MSEASEIFHELMFGEGSWLGLILLLGLCLVMTYTFKRSGVVFFPITTLLGIAYLTEGLGWHSLIMFIATAFILLNLAKELR